MNECDCETKQGHPEAKPLGWLGDTKGREHRRRSKRFDPVFICSKVKAVEFSISLPFLGPDEPRESPPVEMDLRLFQGDILPVSVFSVDDIVFMVKTDYNVQANYSLNEGTREITLPPEALLLVDGNNPNLADGGLNHPKDTSFIFGESSHRIPASESAVPLADELMKLNGIGIPFQKHNEISISELSELGFIDRSFLRFKIIHVAHGSGFFDMVISIPRCFDWSVKPPPRRRLLRSRRVTRLEEDREDEA